MNLKILNLPNISLSFPEDKENEVLRDNLFPLVKNYFETGKNILFIEGDHDIGKTTFLKQYVKFEPDRSFSSFIKQSSSTFVFDEIIIDLSNQINWLLYQKEIEDYTTVNVEFFHKLSLHLKRFKKRNGIHINFIIDGMDDYREEHYYHQSIKKLFEILPIGEDGFNFLFSGSSERFSKLIPDRYHERVRAYPLSPLTKDETKQYLKKFDCCRVGSEKVTLLDAIWNCCNKGYPGKINNFIRILSNSDSSIDDLLDDLENKSFYDIDWTNIQNKEDKTLIQIISFIALDDNVYTIDKLSKLIKTSSDKIEETIRMVSCLEINIENEVRFISLPHKRYFCAVLKEFTDNIVNENITFLIENNESEENLFLLPDYYEKVKRYSEIVQLITPDYLPKIIKRSKSLTAILQKLSIGYRAAVSLKKDDYILQYAMEISLLQNIEGLHVWDSEIEARISVNDFETAIKLAQSAFLKEDQLGLLAKISKQRSVKKLSIDETIQDQIKILCNEVDFTLLKTNKTIDIASDLLYSEPNLAFNLIKLTSENSTIKSVNTWAIAKLSVSAIESDEKTEGKSNKIANILNDPRLEKINKALAALLKNYTTKDFLLELKEKENDLDKLSFIQLWISENKYRKDVEIILDYALDHILKTNSQQLANISLLTELTSALTSISNNKIVEELVVRFEDFDNEADHSGPTIKFFEFKANIIKALIGIDYNKAIRLWNSLFDKIKNEEDKITKAECFAILYKLILDVGKKNLGKNQSYFPDHIESGLKNAVIDVLKFTADHNSTLQEIVSIIAECDPAYAADLSLKANTLNRRDLLLYKVIEASLTNTIDKVNLDLLYDIYLKINNPTIKEASLKRVMERLRKEEKIEPGTLDSIKKISKEIRSIQGTVSKANTESLFLQILERDLEANAREIKAGLSNLREYWSNLNDDKISKIEVAYYLANDLEAIDHQAAVLYINEAELIKEEIWVDSINTINLYINTVRLLIRIFSGMVKGDKEVKVHVTKIVNLINRIPSISNQINLFSDIAYYALQKKEMNLTGQLVSKNIKPLYLSLTDKSIQNEILVELSVLFFHDNQQVALGHIKALPTSLKEEAISNIISYLLKNEIPHESYVEREKSLKPEFDKIETTINLLDFLDTDGIIYYHISEISNIVSDYKKYTEPQRGSSYRKLKELVIKKLPNKHYIKHDGYKIISLAEISAITKDASCDYKAFEKLMEDSRKIENQSDKAFVFSVLADVVSKLKLRSKEDGYKKELITEALTLIGNLNCDVEFITRIYDISAPLKKNNITKWRENMRLALEKTVDMSGRNGVNDKQKRLIDSVHRLDKSFAKQLIQIFDKDEARSNQLQGFKSRIKFYKLKDKIINSTTDTTLNRSEEKHINEVCWALLTELNSDQIVTKKVEDLRWLIDYAASKPILEVFPVYSYYFQNLANRYEKGMESETLIESTFNNLISIAETINLLALNYKESESIPTQEKIKNLNKKSTLFLVGEREEAINFIKYWLKDNCQEFIKICDPYFSVEDLEFIKMILEIEKNIKIDILTSYEHYGLDYNYKKNFKSHWENLSRQEPPITDFFIVGKKGTSGVSPFHDRYIITKNSGLRIGTSLKSLGIDKVSEISLMDNSESYNVEQNFIDKYLFRREIQSEGIKLESEAFTL